MSECDKLDWPGTVVVLNKGVYAAHVSVERFAYICRKRFRLLFGKSLDPERANKLIGRESFGTDDLGQPACTDPAHVFHLPEPVLCMRKAEREGGVQSVFSEDMGDPFFVSNNLNSGSEVCDEDRSCRLWQRSAKPDKTEKGADRGKDEEGGGAYARFAKHGSKD
ncbi:MAG: hypothetical protein VXV97_12780 [Pseudomonadota bacterium]|nr:hypothetical protein [Pseudomonadota bacterium]